MTANKNKRVEIRMSEDNHAKLQRFIRKNPRIDGIKTNSTNVIERGLRLFYKQHKFEQEKK